MPRTGRGQKLRPISFRTNGCGVRLGGRRRGGRDLAAIRTSVRVRYRWNVRLVRLRAREGFQHPLSNVASGLADIDRLAPGSHLCVRRGSQGLQNHNGALPTTNVRLVRLSAREGFQHPLSNVASGLADIDRLAPGSHLCVRRGSQGSQNRNRALTRPHPADRR
jgi:hypothetical protein